MQQSAHLFKNIREGLSIKTQLPAGGLDIWWVPLPDIEYENLLSDYGGCLSREECQRLQSRRLPKGQFQFVFTRVVLRHLLSGYHPELKPHQWQIGRSGSGRPHLSHAQTPLSFNLTHTDSCLIFAFSQYADPGVDVEQLSRPIDIDAIAERYFSKQEYSELRQLPESERSELFYRLWTLKEAAVKASGLGVAKGLRRFQFSQPGTGAFSHQVDATGTEILSGEFRFWSACFQGHAVAAALMSQQGNKLAVIEPVSRYFEWPGVVSDFCPGWIKSQSRNSSTNFEP